MAGLDVVGGVEVGYGAGDLENAVVGAGGEAQAGDGVFEELFAVGVDGAEFADHFGHHLGVGIGGLFGAITGGLAVAGGDDPGADRVGVFGRGWGAEFFVFYGRDFDVDVDAVEERAGDFGDVALDHGRGAVALAGGVAEVAAGAGIHGGGEHESRGESYGDGG